MYFKRNENNKLSCEVLELQVLIDDILFDADPKNAHELSWCRDAIVEAVLTSSGDYASDNNISDYKEAEYYGL